ncbi:hypothetical protein GA0115280_117588, partial [Streptomyces sp. Cmuel-A718b]
AVGHDRHRLPLYGYGDGVRRPGRDGRMGPDHGGPLCGARSLGLAGRRSGCLIGRRRDGRHGGGRRGALDRRSHRCGGGCGLPGTGLGVGGSGLRHVAPPSGRDDRAGRPAARRHRGPRKPFGGSGVDAQGAVRKQGAWPPAPGGERGGGRRCRTAGAVFRRRTVPGDGPDAYRGRGSGGDGRALDGGGPGRFGGAAGSGGCRPHGHRGGLARRCRGRGRNCGPGAGSCRRSGTRSPVRVRARHGGRTVTEQRSAAAEPGGRRQRGKRGPDPTAHPGGGVRPRAGARCTEGEGSDGFDDG